MRSSRFILPLFALAIVAATSVGFAQNSTAPAATVLTSTGSVQALTAGASRGLQVGGGVNQGDSIVTGENASVGLSFQDGEVLYILGNARVTITTYVYDPANPAQ